MEYATKICIITRDKKVLLILRSEKEWNRHEWDLPGGRVGNNETVMEAIKRELKEEIGYNLDENPIPIRMWSVESIGLCGITFKVNIKNEFVPLLSEEHVDYIWADKNKLKEIENINHGLLKDIYLSLD